MTQRSAGLLLYRRRAGRLEVLLVHPGGPFWARRDAGAWSIPKGEYQPDEDARAAACREFTEETGLPPPEPLVPLGEVTQANRKVVTAWAGEGEVDPAAIRSNLFEMEWPPRSGRRQSFPEVDRAGWFDLAAAAEKIIPGQRPLLDRLAALLAER